MNYFMIGGDKQEYGPADADTVRQWIREGRANADTLLRPVSETEFRALKTFPEFFPELAATITATGAEAPQIITVSVDTPVRVRHAFARAWHLVNHHFRVIAIGTITVWMALTSLLLFPFIGPILSMIFAGPLLGGLFLLFLKLIREGAAAPGDIFFLIRNNALSLIVVSVVSSILTEVALTCCCILPGIYLQIAWLFGIPIVADRGINFWAGLEISRRVITPHWFKFCGLFIVAFLPVVVFHFYYSARLAADLSPYFSQILDLYKRAVENGAFNRADFEPIFKSLQDEVLVRYASWYLVRQFLLLISLPLGIGSFAVVYEDLFGRKK